MKIKAIFTLVFLLFYLEGKTQVLNLKRTFPVEEAVAVSADPEGNLYLSTRKGDIKKYSSKGIELGTYSPSSAGNFSILDASSPLQVKAFNENNQTIGYLDRFLNLSSSFQLPAERFNYISALCWSAGNSIWLIDAGNLELIRWRIETREVLFSLNLSQHLPKEGIDIVLLREYQHKLYLFGTNKLLIFDQLGNYEKELSLPDWESMAFTEDEMILLTQDSLTFIHLYSSTARKIPLPEGKKYEHIVHSKGEVFLLTPEQAEVYLLVP